MRPVAGETLSRPLHAINEETFGNKQSWLAVGRETTETGGPERGARETTSPLGKQES